MKKTTLIFVSILLLLAACQQQNDEEQATPEAIQANVVEQVPEEITETAVSPQPTSPASTQPAHSDDLDIFRLGLTPSAQDSA